MQLKEVEAAIDRFFADTSRSKSATREDLVSLRDHIAILIESLDNDDADADED
jgi:hypothetical protein